ncbi:DUF448 domain-containing protein [Halalkalibacillus sediminis]|uniref:DUF448 domain-containing protein n=1 Tax=Halalkalibacillus sediminis TaxID=2018042 RepID=A0A2I0QWE2_9BACI|nr:YlxR family protein [Halalkalibacillus sediminis]PKR78661.1 DUF448 domain-containing protein [Halalkalibacillus sediminis]
MTKRKKEPLRKCVVTQEMLPKKELIRIVKNKQGEVFVDESGKQNGRGAYIQRNRSVIEDAKQNRALQKHLKVKMDDSIYDDLLDRVGE